MYIPSNCGDMSRHDRIRRGEQGSVLIIAVIFVAVAAIVGMQVSTVTKTYLERDKRYNSKLSPLLTSKVSAALAEVHAKMNCPWSIRMTDRFECAQPGDPAVIYLNKDTTIVPTGGATIVPAGFTTPGVTLRFRCLDPAHFRLEIKPSTVWVDTGAVIDCLDP